MTSYGPVAKRARNDWDSVIKSDWGCVIKNDWRVKKENRETSFSLSFSEKTDAARKFHAAFQSDMVTDSQENFSGNTDCILVFYCQGSKIYSPISTPLVSALLPNLRFLCPELVDNRIIQLPIELDGHAVKFLLDYAHGQASVEIFQDINFAQQVLVAAVYFGFQEVADALVDLCEHLSIADTVDYVAGIEGPECLSSFQTSTQDEDIEKAEIKPFQYIEN